MSKYRNKKVVVNGIKFDSKAEGEYYLIARTFASKHGLELRLQEKFQLQEKFKLLTKTYREINYIPDFTFYRDGKLIKVVDVKGMQTKEFKLKAKMFCSKYQMPIFLAKKTPRGFEEMVF